jgi:hypothetical protein
VPAAVAAALLIRPCPVLAQAPAEWFGTWHLNLTKSTYDPGPPPYKRANYTIEPWESGLKVVYEMVHPRGGVTRLEWTGRLDGREYPLRGLDEVVTYAYTRQPDGTCEVVVRRDGRVAAMSTISLSADGRTMTTTTRGEDSRGRLVATTTVYERE